MSLARVWSRLSERSPARRSVPAAAGSGPAEQPLAFRSVSRTHVGRVRAVNEDRVFDCPQAGLWAVADGMGGHDAGDVAAEAVMRAFHALVRDTPRIDDEAIARVIAETNAEIARHAAARGQTSGATTVVLRAEAGTATLFWAGDSRAYRLRGDGADLLTRDHSVVQDLIDAGLVDPAAADHHPQSHIVTRALGATDPLVVERRQAPIAPGDMLLLCSDGLSRQNEIGIARARGGDLDATADALLASALAAGGRDNISLVLIDVLAAKPG